MFSSVNRGTAHGLSVLTTKRVFHTCLPSPVTLKSQGVSRFRFVGEETEAAQRGSINGPAPHLLEVEGTQR